MKLRSSFTILIFVLICLLSNTNSQYRVIGGSNWNIRNSPYVVSINDTREYICVGSLITMERVVTAAHCLVDLTANDITVAAGVTDLRDLPANGQTRIAQHIHRPPDFNYELMHMDIAVIIVCDPFVECDTIKTIQLCATQLNPGEAIRVAGWGCRNRQCIDYSSILQSVVMYIIEKNQCAARYATEEKFLTETMICAGCQGADTCWGDSGGPGVVDGRLCSVVLGGISSPDFYFPNLHTDINNANVRAFINSVK